MLYRAEAREETIHVLLVLHRIYVTLLVARVNHRGDGAWRIILILLPDYVLLRYWRRMVDV